MQTQGPAITLSSRSCRQVTQLGARRAQGVADLEAATHRDQAHAHHNAVFDTDVSRGPAAAAAGQDHTLVSEAAIGIGHGLAGIGTKITPGLGDGDALGRGPDARAHPAIDADAALISRQIQHIGATGAAIDTPGDTQITGLFRGRIAHAHHHISVKSNRVIDHGALGHGQHRAIGKHRGVARAKNGQLFTFDRARHFHLAAHPRGLDGQGHRQDQFRITTAHGHRVGSTG